VTRGHLKVITPPTVEPVTLAEACNQCHAEQGIEDAWFIDTIKAAREACENFQWRAYNNQVIELSFDELPEMPITLPRSPVSAVTSVEIYDIDNVKTTMSLSDFFIDLDSEPARLSFNYGKTWPAVNSRYLSAVKMRYTAGYGAAASAVPSTVKKAMLLYIAYMYENRSGEVVEIPRAFYDLLRPERLYQ
jgi:uncharacterized phiE125 gp8 family phage protein